MLTFFLIIYIFFLRMTLFSFLCQFGSTFFCRNVVIEEEKCTRNNEESRNADQFVMRRTGEFPQKLIRLMIVELTILLYTTKLIRLVKESPKLSDQNQVKKQSTKSLMVKSALHQRIL